MITDFRFILNLFNDNYTINKKDFYIKLQEIKNDRKDIFKTKKQMVNSGIIIEKEDIVELDKKWTKFLPTYEEILSARINSEYLINKKDFMTTEEIEIFNAKISAMSIIDIYSIISAFYMFGINKLWEGNIKNE